MVHLMRSKRFGVGTKALSADGTECEHQTKSSNACGFGPAFAAELFVATPKRRCFFYVQ
ncbi:hypothetical protein LFUMFP_130069 [Latilactobacillus fuchuensis]|uniref:Uncharacterized protein n=1 Tax=Latilactobacillus fuchuensis TaxID=164393 RepID=A0A2N9DTP3_9LACO|nr:hypothetical protein LFUMFP_130069 [Latilactobacillus fuchuensis]